LPVDPSAETNRLETCSSRDVRKRIQHMVGRLKKDIEKTILAFLESDDDWIWMKMPTGVI